MSTFKSPTYDPARGGHAPGDIRDAFLEAIEAYEAWPDGDPEPTVEVRGRDLPISEVCGLVWNCTDTMPSVFAEAVEEIAPRIDHERSNASTYARASRLLKWAIEFALERDALASGSAQTIITGLR